MEFEINPQRQAYLDARGKIVLNACPGSGKTTAIARKLMLLQEEYKTTRGRFSGIACLSFTNTAKDEINEKYTQLSGNYLGFPHKVSTIDSFINQYITLPFYYLLKKPSSRPKIIDDEKYLDSMWEIKYLDKKGKIKDGLKTSLLKFKAKNNRNIFHIYAPRKIRIEVNGSFTFRGNPPDPHKVDVNVFNEYAAHLFKSRLSKGLISTQDSAFIALHLLKKHPKIGNWLALRFPHIIVDEAQDTSAVQHALFDKLAELGLLNLEFIGDPYQSLYEWRDADPSLFNTKYADAEKWQGLDLTDNRRSPQRIIDCFSILRKQGDPAINTACNTDIQLPVMVYRYNETNSPLIVRHFDQCCKESRLKDNQIVVRGNALKNQMLGKLADQFPWKRDLPYRIIDAKHKYDGNEIKAAIKAIRSIAVLLIAPGKEMVDIKKLEKDLKTNNQFNALLLNLLHDLPSFDQTISDWTTSAETFLKERLNLAENVNFEQKERSYKGKFDKAILNEPLKDHFKRSYSESRIPITTVHQVKGKSLDSILVFFNEKKHKDNITFSDIEPSGQNFPSEKQRIIYVALSRPKHLLALAFPESISEDELKAKFRKGIKIVTIKELEI
ncbi:ATP-dependent helicase [Salinimicrobium sp. CDJ15-81-2]|nr:ATP-dependent helicase [Salinimicrobium nanhaiense]